MDKVVAMTTRFVPGAYDSEVISPEDLAEIVAAQKKKHDAEILEETEYDAEILPAMRGVWETSGDVVVTMPAGEYVSNDNGDKFKGLRPTRRP